MRPRSRPRSCTPECKPGRGNPDVGDPRVDIHARPINTARRELCNSYRPKRTPSQPVTCGRSELRRLNRGALLAPRQVWISQAQPNTISGMPTRAVALRALKRGRASRDDNRVSIGGPFREVGVAILIGRSDGPILRQVTTPYSGGGRCGKGDGRPRDPPRASPIQTDAYG